MSDLQTSFSRRRFAALCGAAGAAAALPGAPAFGQQPQNTSAVVVEDPLLMLIRDAKVHKELSLDEKQIGAIRNATDAVDPAYFLMRDFPPAVRAAKSKPLIAQVERRLEQVLQGTQLRRLRQLVAQSQGHRSLLSDANARTMRFDGSQRSRLNEIAQDTEKEKQKLYEKAKNGESREKIQQQITELMKDEQKRFVDVLTVPQKRLVSSVFGNTFERNRNQLPHFKPPKMPLPGPWINSSPLTLEQLKGKVVALHYYAFA